MRSGQGVTTGGEGTIKAGQHATSSFNKPIFNNVYSKNILPKIRDGAFVINFDEYRSVRTH